MARFGFPLVVDEVTVRVIAVCVLVVGVAALLTGAWWLYAALAVDFVLRCGLGPRYSPLAQLASRVIRPRLALHPRPTPGTPKRFAAGIGVVLAGAAAVAAALAPGSAPAAALSFALGTLLVVVPAMEGAAGLCLGCVIFARLMSWGLVPARICAECADITRRTAMVQA